MKKLEVEVLEIVRQYLKANGYTGLYCDYCGCEVDDLAPCDEGCGKCSAGYKNTCKNCSEKETWWSFEITE